jgi:DNA-binding MarR family transcriptional regulator
MSTDPVVATLTEWMDVSMRHSMRNLIRYARENGLSMSHLGAILHVHRIGCCGVTEIGDHLGVTSAAASQMLDRLVQQGLVQRSEDPVDRRVKRIVLTEKGQRMFKEGLQARQSWLDDLAGTLSDQEKDLITSAFQILILKASRLSYSAFSTE